MVNMNDHDIHLAADSSKLVLYHMASFCRLNCTFAMRDIFKVKQSPMLTSLIFEASLSILAPYRIGHQPVQHQPLGI